MECFDLVGDPFELHNDADSAAAAQLAHRLIAALEVTADDFAGLDALRARYLVAR